MNWPLNPPPAGECKMIPMLFEPGTVIGGLESTEQGAFLQTNDPATPVEGRPIEITVYLCPPDPNNADSWLAPRGHLVDWFRMIGKIEGPNGTHAVIIKQK